MYVIYVCLLFSSPCWLPENLLIIIFESSFWRSVTKNFKISKRLWQSLVTSRRSLSVFWFRFLSGFLRAADGNVKVYIYIEACVNNQNTDQICARKFLVIRANFVEIIKRIGNWSGKCMVRIVASLPENTGNIHKQQ